MKSAKTRSSPVAAVLEDSAPTDLPQYGADPQQSKIWRYGRTAYYA
jgi:hypothetical protein